jgi:hypothetical protein
MNAITTGVSIVLAGQFAPDDFHPNKLADGRVIAKKVAESASITALLPMHTLQFKLSWADILVQENRFQVTSIEAPHIRICDLVLKALGDLSPSSTVFQFGINVDRHYDFGSVDARNEFGKRIAPPDAWGPWGREMLDSMTGEHKGTSLQGGVLTVHMRQPFVEDGLTGWRDVVVVPSSEIPNNTGIFIRSNHHHQLTKLDSSPELSTQPSLNRKDTSFLLATLSSRFEKSVEDALSIFEGVIV